MSSGHLHDELSLVYVIGRVNQGIRRGMSERLAPWKLSVQEFTALSILSKRPGLSNAQLSRRALVTPQTMIEILSKLEERGLVRRTVDPSHGRIRRVALTSAGQELLEQTNPEIQIIQERLLSSVAEDDLAAMKRALSIAMQNLSDRPQ